LSDPALHREDSAAAALNDWLQRLEVLHPKKIDLSLERIRSVLHTLALARPPYRVLTVGGTNGKGSCVALLDSMYRHGAYRVGAYTSPHLWRFNERIRVDGVDADDATLVALFERIDRARGATTLSYFEFATVAALLYFADRGADLAVLEVGLGGRLDAVNAVDADLALIASVAIDHTNWLGSTREAIGFEKAGILRPGRPAILGERDPPQSVLDHAAAIGAVVWRAGIDFDLHRHADAGWDYRGAGLVLADLPPSALPGERQYDNAAACVAATEALRDTLPLDPDSIAAALRDLQLPGRLQRVVIDGVEWVFDVAHNPAAAAGLAAELARSPASGRTFAVVGLMADKDIGGVLAPFDGLVDEWLLTRADSERAAETSMLAAALAGCRAAVVSSSDGPAQTGSIAATRAARGDRIVVFGSFQVVGPVMAALQL
jgi:dihydrofolate synthase/folylpolyglutamate synthase